MAKRSPWDLEILKNLNKNYSDFHFRPMSNSVSDFIVVMTTLPESEQANRIAKILVEEKLAACVQILPAMTSTYIWQDQLCQESEHLLLIKTIATNYSILSDKLRSLHPYQTPEIIAIPAIAIEQNYALWLSAACEKIS